jgi:maleylacetoacetate isomerase
MKLYTYFRSSAAYRVRIALNLKGLAYEAIPVHLLRGGGEQKQAAYKDVNPLGLVPTLVTDAAVFTQSLAIMEWLDETYPEPPLLPKPADARAQVRAIAHTIASDIHPLNNLRVLGYLTKTLGMTDEQKSAWIRHWIEDGLLAVERLLVTTGTRGRYCYSDTPSMADCCLVPQVFNARRFHCNLDHLPILSGIVAACEDLEAFRAAAPAQQPDYE